MNKLRKGFKHVEPTKKEIMSMPKAKARQYLSKEKKEKGKGEPKAWHKAEMKILKRKVK